MKGGGREREGQTDRWGIGGFMVTTRSYNEHSVAWRTILLKKRNPKLQGALSHSAPTVGESSLIV